MSQASVEAITGLVVAVGGLVTAVVALIHALQAKRDMNGVAVVARGADAKADAAVAVANGVKAAGNA
jgi:hypothetical protein